MKKRLTAFVIALLLCANALPLGARALTSTSGEYEGLNWTLENGVLTIGGEGEIYYYSAFDGDGRVAPTWETYREEITKVIIKEGVTGTEEYTFYGYPALETVTLPESFDFIGAHAFENCEKLSEIQGLEYVEYFSRNCLTGTAITAASPFVITNGELQYCDYDNPYHDPEDIIVPDGVTSIGRDAFGSLLHFNVWDYSSDPFAEHTVNEMYFTITLPESVQKIDDYAFAGLCMLTDINIPEGVTEIGDYAFFSCIRLDAAMLGKNMRSVGDYAFFNCKEMNTMTVLSENISFGTMAYGTLINADQCLIDQGHYTEESLTEKISKSGDPYLCDELGALRVDIFGDESYIYAEDGFVAGEQEVYLYPSPAAFLRSTKNVLANESGVGFIELNTLGNADSDTAINSNDAAAVLIAAAEQGATGESGLSAMQENTLDVNSDGVMNAVDAAWILKYAAYKGGGGTLPLYAFVME